MDTDTAMTEAEMVEIDERIEAQREQAQMLRDQMDCECPDPTCPVAHES